MKLLLCVFAILIVVVSAAFTAKSNADIAYAKGRSQGIKEMQEPFNNAMYAYKEMKTNYEQMAVLNKRNLANLESCIGTLRSVGGK